MSAALQTWTSALSSVEWVDGVVCVEVDVSIRLAPTDVSALKAGDSSVTAGHAKVGVHFGTDHAYKRTSLSSMC